VTGSAPGEGFWVLATRDASTLRVVLASFSASDPRARTVRIDGASGTGTIEHLQPDGSAAPTSSPFDGVVTLAPNDAVLIEIPLAAQETSTAPITATAPAGVSQLPVTGGDATTTGAFLLGLAALLALALLRRGRLTAWS
jgi:LPXTG-motif cell wall-anchored protein